MTATPVVPTLQDPTTGNRPPGALFGASCERRANDAGPIAALALGICRSGSAPAASVRGPAPVGGAHKLETVIFAGRCFWGVQGVLEHVRGVQSATSGYAGGTAETATFAPPPPPQDRLGFVFPAAFRLGSGPSAGSLTDELSGTKRQISLGGVGNASASPSNAMLPPETRQ
jgi:hypothetical protein